MGKSSHTEKIESSFVIDEVEGYIGINERGVPNATSLATRQMVILLTRLRRYRRKY